MKVERFGPRRAVVRLTIFAATVAAVAFFAIAAHTSAAGCFATPSACGYPDATDAGVPAGTALTTVSSVTLGAGQTLEGKIVTNGVRVTRSGATIRNSVIKTPSGGNGSTAIEMGGGATNFTIEHSEVTGNSFKTNAPESNVWNRYENAGFRVIGSYLHGVPDNIEGGIAEVPHSFIAVDAEYSGAHGENIYLYGSTANVQRSTLYNESDETSLIFGDGICGKGNTVTVENSLLAGGGYMLQPNSKGVSAPVRIVGERVGRCLRPPIGLRRRLRLRDRQGRRRLLASRRPLRPRHRTRELRRLVGQHLGRQLAARLRQRTNGLRHRQSAGRNPEGNAGRDAASRNPTSGNPGQDDPADRWRHQADRIGKRQDAAGQGRDAGQRLEAGDRRIDAGLPRAWRRGDGEVRRSGRLQPRPGIGRRG